MMIEPLPEEDDVIRIFNHHVSRMALILLLKFRLRGDAEQVVLSVKGSR